MKITDLFKKWHWVIFGPSDEFLVLADSIESVQADLKRKIEELRDDFENHQRYMHSQLDFYKALHDHQIEELAKVPNEKQVIRKTVKCTIATAPKNKPTLKRVK